MSPPTPLSDITLPAVFALGAIAGEHPAIAKAVARETARMTQCGRKFVSVLGEVFIEQEANDVAGFGVSDLSPRRW